MFITLVSIFESQWFAIAVLGLLLTASVWAFASYWYTAKTPARRRHWKRKEHEREHGTTKPCKSCGDKQQPLNTGTSE